MHKIDGNEEAPLKAAEQNEHLTYSLLLLVLQMNWIVFHRPISKCTQINGLEEAPLKAAVQN